MIVLAKSNPKVASYKVNTHESNAKAYMTFIYYTDIVIVSVVSNKKTAICRFSYDQLKTKIQILHDSIQDELSKLLLFICKMVEVPGHFFTKHFVILVIVLIRVNLKPMFHGFDCDE